jgi:D-glycero-D-manno-heptose 1,7-bisphosphate phosphatase
MDLKGVPAVGDHVRDLQAAAAVGCAPHLVLTGKGAQHKGQTALPNEFPANTQVHEDLSAFVDHLLIKTQASAKSSNKSSSASSNLGSKK